MKGGRSALPAGWITDVGAAAANGSAPDNPIGYGGYTFNAASGEYLVRHRSYEPELGRFLQRDPSGYADGMSLYLYASASPWGMLDPMGLETWFERMGRWTAMNRRSPLRGTVAGNLAGISGAAIGGAYEAAAGTAAGIGRTVERGYGQPIGVAAVLISDTVGAARAQERTVASIEGREPTVLGAAGRIPAIATGVDAVATGISGFDRTSGAIIRDPFDRAQLIGQGGLQGLSTAIGGPIALRGSATSRVSTIATEPCPVDLTLEGGRIFSSPDPKVGWLATQLERRYHWHVQSVNENVYWPSGRRATDLDIRLRNAVVQVKENTVQGIGRQLQRSEALTGLPAFGYVPGAPRGAIRALQRQGFAVTDDYQLLLDTLGP